LSATLRERSRETFKLSTFLSRKNPRVYNVILGNIDRKLLIPEMAEWKKFFRADYFELSTANEKTIIQTDNYDISGRDVSTNSRMICYRLKRAPGWKLK
jgi:hypothetical protein